ncbi:DUF4397 domain-containing protein [Deinococcus peraridilitoris]|uniref:Alginate O-acetyl transferase AlgF n=1 Tax=Deinococcus peraridilitoris (strain DSM 19664 / LMG 22246 / CIP 109416 / KR-200) TaxID=937777 RepID=L0A6B6_DEIPD|nr:DUF4397 domain-containing protein [Deinococcus peraridilitoris]AFZ68560.1 Alginate O-acetyl transferase AlgF [Deinococcus peraridilitoris DSM 19664]
MKKILTLSALALTATLAATQVSAQMASGNDAFVRVVHASPDAPAVDVYVDGMRTVAGAAFKAATPYGEVPAGKHKVMVTAAGDKNTVVFQADVDLKAGTYYTVAAVGQLANIKPKIFTTTGLNKDKAKAEVNVYHLSPNGPRVQTLAADLNNAALLKNGIAYGNKETLMVNPMGVNLNVVPFGKMEPVVKNLSGISVAGGKSYSVFAVGLVGANGTQGFDLVAVEDKVVMGSMAAK